MEKYLNKQFNSHLEFKKFLNGYPIFKLVRNNQNKNSADRVSDKLIF